MCGGGVLSYMVLIPMIKFFGEHIATPVAPGRTLIANMAPDDVRTAYILYIGSGAVAAGGIISLLRSLPTIWHGLREGLRDVGFLNLGAKAAVSREGVVPRTERDLSMKFVGIGIIILMAAIMAAPMLLDAGIGTKLMGAVLIVLFGFLFVTVSSRLTGEIGSSSNPISGMTIATLLLTCLIFLVVGWTGSAYYVTALSIGAIVCIASSNGGSTSQDLKTGHILGATPKYLQIAILFGSFASALALGPMLLVLNDAAATYVPVAEVAPAGSMSTRQRSRSTRGSGGRRRAMTPIPTLSGTGATLQGASPRNTSWMRRATRSGSWTPASTGPTPGGPTVRR